MLSSHCSFRVSTVDWSTSAARRGRFPGPGMCGAATVAQPTGVHEHVPRRHAALVAMTSDRDGVEK